MTGDNFDTEASVISSGKKGKLSKDRLREFAGMHDDTQSMISMQSNLTGFSRKSGVSMIDIDSIVSTGSRKAPGEKGLKAAAERRLQKAQMASIEANLKRIQESDDLTYSANLD